MSLLGGVNTGLLAVQTARGQDGKVNKLPDSARHESIDLGILAGLNINVSRISFSLKYNFGLIPVETFRFSDVQGNVFAEKQMKNRFLQVGVGYLIDFKI